MASEKIKRILTQDGLKEAVGELSYFARKILHDINMTPSLWEIKMIQYLERHQPNVPSNPKDRSYARGNLNTQFTNQQMTWRTFMEFLLFLNPIKIRLELHLTWANNRTTIHTMNIRTRQGGDLASPADEEFAPVSPPADLERPESSPDDIPDVEL